MTDDAFLDPIRREGERFRRGPVCALCRHSTFTAADLPDLAPPKDGSAICDESIRFERCAQINLNVTADAGRDCRKFSRKPMGLP